MNARSIIPAVVALLLAAGLAACREKQPDSPAPPPDPEAVPSS